MTSAVLDRVGFQMPALREGELILHAGGSRLPTPEESELLKLGNAHLPRPATALPYRFQDDYSRDTVDTPQRVAVLDNGRLRATFLLDLGGRLWSLRDLEQDRELLHQPDVIQLANLAIRNAWFTGGVEWNLGMTGHWGMTCEPVNAAVLDEGHLRMWAFERVTNLVWQLDVLLPDGADVLYVHVTLTNPHAHDVPLYWWSNIAVPQTRETRVLVDAERAYHFGYAFTLSEVDYPRRDGVDVSHPEQHDGCADYFYLQRSRLPWVAAVEPDGHGLGQASTANLPGRKMFTWGDGRGGRTWQEWLSGSGAYTEIQAGLGYTQLEHLRLRAGETLAFTESYRPVHVDAPNGPWEEAITQAEAACVDHAGLEGAHEQLAGLAAVPVADDQAWLVPGDWGALEVAAGFLTATERTPFAVDDLSREQAAWLDVVRQGRVDPVLRTSAQTGPQWLLALQEAEDSWVARLLLGHALHASGDTRRARSLWQTSHEDHASADALRALAMTESDTGEQAALLLAAHQLEPGRRGLAIETLTALLAADRHDEALDVVRGLSPAIRDVPRVTYLECQALVRVGDVEAIGEILARPLVLPDLREGDVALDQLWRDFQELKGTNDPLPAHYDFRMASAQEEPAWT